VELIRFSLDVGGEKKIGRWPPNPKEEKKALEKAQLDLWININYERYLFKFGSAD
jgi:hypothetical protein